MQHAFPAARPELSEGVRVMKSQASLIRLKMFQVREKQRHLLQLETMATEFKRMAGELEAQIAAEEKKAGITDTNHFAYPIFAKATRQRWKNLLDSVRNLQGQKEAAELGLHQAQSELDHARALEQRENPPFYAEENIMFAQRRAMIG